MRIKEVELRWVEMRVNGMLLELRQVRIDGGPWITAKYGYAPSIKFGDLSVPEQKDMLHQFTQGMLKAAQEPSDASPLS